MSIGFVEMIKKDPTALSLLFANIITLILAVVFSWNLLELMWVYLAQSVIIGLFNFLKMVKISLSPESKGMAQAMGLFLSFFFLVHYGGFHLGYLIFLTVFSILPFFGGQSINIIAFFPFLLLTSFIFFLNHLFSFLYFSKKQSAGGKTVEVNSLTKLMFRPYARIIPMHLTIILGGVVLSMGVFNVYILILFLVLKTGADLKMHLSEHNGDY